MKLTITTLVIIEGSYIQGIFHSLEEHPGKAYQELVDQVENEYGYDADKDHVPLHFKTIQDIENYFELVHIETQITSTREIPIEQNKRVQTKIKEIIYNNLYDTLVEELKDTISRFKAQYNIQEINPYISDILQNPEDLISRSNTKEYR